MSPSSDDRQPDGPSPGAVPAPADAPRESLAAFVSEVTGQEVSRVEETLGDGYVRLRVAEAERRQAAHDIRWVEDAVLELLRNARDARAARIFVATASTGPQRRVVVVDDGIGIPPALHERIFEARVTSKLDTMVVDGWGIHGRGMALFAIRENALEARVAASAPGLGTSIATVFDTRRLPERRDQSSWPTRDEGDDGEGRLRGPHNIPRTCVELALSEEGAPDVYLGSPAEIVASLRASARGSASEARILFTEDLAELPLGLRLLAAPDAATLVGQAQVLGLDISERTAHRILAGAIRPLRSVGARLRHRPGTAPRTPVDLTRDRRGLRLSAEDTREFQGRLTRAFDTLGSRYFLELMEPPTVKVARGRITVTFRVANEDL